MKFTTVFTLISIFSVSLAFAVEPNASGGKVAHPPITEIIPLVELDGKQPIACGFMATETHDGATKELRVALERKPPSTALRISARYTSESTGWLQIPVRVFEVPGVDIVFTTQGALGTTQELVADGDTVAAFMQKLMLVGGEAAFQRIEKEFRFRLKGPLPQNVRATYLNCTGDMYRQE